MEITKDNVYDFLTKTAENIRDHTEELKKFQELNKAMNKEGYQAWITPKGTYWAKENKGVLELHPMYNEQSEELKKNY